MDTSKKNVEMCRKAKEIQENHTTVEFDIYYVDFSKSGWKNDNEICSAEHNYDEKGNEIWEVPYVHENREYDERDCRMRYIWLPHQGQLQKMVDKKKATAYLPHQKCTAVWLLNYIFTRSINKGWWGKYIDGEPCALADFNVYYVKFDSMEQLWLAFVMAEKFNKRWNDKKKEWSKCGEINQTFLGGVIKEIED